MVIDERGLCRILNREYRTGYQICPLQEDDGTKLMINGSYWAVSAYIDELPRKVLGTLVEHVGTIPVEPLKVMKDCPNQGVMETGAQRKFSELASPSISWQQAEQLPIILHGHWQLYQMPDNSIIGFDTAYLSMVSDDGHEHGVLIRETPDGTGPALWELDDESICILPVRLKQTDGILINHLEQITWSQVDAPAEPLDNVSFFPGAEPGDGEE